MHQTITILGTGKKALVDIKGEDEVEVLNITIFHDNGKIAYYGRKECRNHQWALYCAIKNYLYEN